jgi:hypothetical protein
MLTEFPQPGYSPNSTIPDDLADDSNQPDTCV